MPSPISAARKQPLTLAQLSSYDDILTDALVDHTYYWTTIPKNRPSYHASRGVKEEEITKIIQSHLVVDPDLEIAESKLLATEGLRKFCNALKTPKEKDDFRAHLRRYMQIYLPDCPFEVSSTNRYTITTHEAAVTARKFVKRGKPIKYLSGIQVVITDKEDKELAKRKKDFSVVVSSRNKCASLFMGPARFANHDCGANARLMITGQSGIEIVATKDIEIGDEITVSYAESYFGEDNCECLCKTCEENLVNGWAQPDGVVVVKKSIEEAPAGEGYSLRRRRRDDSCASASRTPSVAPCLRPRVPKSRSKTLKIDSERAESFASPPPQGLLREKRKREFESMTTPPVTPAKKLKTLQYEVQPMPTPEGLSQTSSDNESPVPLSPSETGSAEAVMTDATTPEAETQEPPLRSPALTPLKSQAPLLKEEDSELSSIRQLEPASTESETQETVAVTPLPTVEHVSLNQPSLFPDTADSPIDALAFVEPIALPPPITPVANKIHEPIITPLAESSVNEEEEEPSRGRRRVGRPRKGEERREEGTDEVISSRRIRTPGDYTLTPVLLSEPNMAWICCTICNDAFVQQNAYFTRSACPRCERHSKIYGYQWPKTEKEGSHDKEERILDHRMIHRFLTNENEAKIRGRKPPPRYIPVSERTPVKRGRGRPRKSSLPGPEAAEDEYVDESHGDELASVRGSSGRRTRASRRVS
ncbi:hypothetical protein F4778DRAFT_426790 [Xylariomycetidae sp. FL2044]|nr:hypothetical protein F4778DRAFT_426790 [Xylariomycetidae sp. FL2044]